MIWKDRNFNYSAKLGSGLNLHVFHSANEDDIRLDMRWIVEVFGCKLSEKFRTGEEAKIAAEVKAREILTDALRILEGK